MARLRGSRVFGKLDMLPGYWQCPLLVKAQDKRCSQVRPLRIPQGVLNATDYFQAVLTRLLEALNYEAWVDDVVFLGACFFTPCMRFLGGSKMWGYS